MVTARALRGKILRLKWLVAATRFEIAMHRHALALKAGFNPDQPRDEHGRWTDAGGSRPDDRSDRWQIVQVIPICILSGIARTTNAFGMKTFTAHYDCIGGRTITRSGLGHRAPGLIRDPLR